MIKIYEPFLDKKNLKYAHQAIDSTWISNLGEYKDKSADFLKEYIKIKNCILINNGTAATHLIYKALKIKKPKIRNILVPNNVYVAAWNSMLFDNDNVRLIPVETNIETWNIDLQSLYKQAGMYDPADTAILIVHNVGGIVNVPEIKRNLSDFEVIEDNCEGLFGKYEQQFSGTKCLASSVSFYGNKTITSGEGGAIFFNDEEMYDSLNRIHTQGQSNKRYVHNLLGYNYRMTNVQAAILFGQLMGLKNILQKKEKVFATYKKNLKKCSSVTFQHQEKECENANWMFAIRIKNNKNFETAKEFFDKNKIETRSMFYPMSHHEHLNRFSNLKIEEKDEILSREVIMFPSSPRLKTAEICYITNKIKEYAECL